MPRIDVQTLKRKDRPAKKFSIGPDTVIVKSLSDAQLMVVQDDANRLYMEYAGIGVPGADEYIKPTKFILVDGQAAEVSFRAIQLAVTLEKAVVREDAEPPYTAAEYLAMFTDDDLAADLSKAGTWAATYRDDSGKASTNEA